MLTKEAVLFAAKSGRESRALDNRDYSRLINFFESADWPIFNFTLKEGTEPPVPRPWTEEEILKQLKRDVEFGFEKALGQRGISAGLMYEVCKMWMWILEDPLQHMEEYAQYGLPLFKAIATKYGFPDEIDGYDGDESRFACEE